MLEKKFKNAEEWWKFYYDNDKTILATSSENMSREKLQNIIKFKNNKNLFKSSGYTWSYRKKIEKPFLQALDKTIL